MSQMPPQTQNPDAVRTYSKADSFVALKGVENGLEAILQRISRLSVTLAQQSGDNYRNSILDRACRALLSNAQQGEPEFHLREHIVGELAHVTDAELPRYLYYRYRYDAFPITQELDAYPPCVQIETTSICNYRCVFCYQTDQSFSDARQGHMGQMTLDTFKQVIDELEGQVEAVTLASRGEPLICRQIEDMLAYAAGKFLGLKINTNAWFLDEKKAHAILQAEPNTLVFSADAADPELYAKLRVNGKLERVLQNVERFAEIRAKHYPQSRTVTRVSGVNYSDQQDLAAIDAFWHRYVDQVAFVDYNPWENAYNAPSNGLNTPCSDLWRRAFVWWDGRVNPCDVDYRSILSLGNIHETPLTRLWTGGSYGQLRQRHQSGERQSLHPCSGCALI